ncbi:MAG TPA: HAD-IIIC family phosphatase [Anaeromyxobacteraceae bacterium]|jgi:FkbH-like protein|nr:HAD-IIIC family phosphatase [Anaeromyxobacteraceae bacterium]
MDDRGAAGLIRRLRRALERHRHDGASELIAGGVSVAIQLAGAPLFLRACDRVGRGVRTMGAPRIVNRGRITIGDDVILCSRWNPIELVTGPAGSLEIGSGAHINFGTAISAQGAVRIGAGAQLGQYVIVSDTEVPGDGGEEPRPIEIGEGAWLAGRVTVLPGARIGAGAVVTAGSLVAGEIPPGVVAGGVPARVIRPVRGASASSAPEAAPRAAPAPAAAPPPAGRGTIIADFTADELARFLADPTHGPPLSAEAAPYDQVAQTLLQGARPDAADFAVVWTRPEGAVPAFARVLGFEEVAEAELLAGVDEFSTLLARGAASWRALYVPTWTLPPDRRGLGCLDARPGGATRALAAMNLRLMDRVAAIGNVYALDAQRWALAGGRAAQSPRAWFVGKVAFGAPVLAEAARDIQAAHRGLMGGARKLVILDLDDTLWGGIVGDVGWEGLRLGGHDPAGEALVAFQHRLKALTRRGVLLAIVSKNDEATALEAIRAHPAMVLREQDFAAWRINWDDKARNVAELVSALNLGLQSAVFIDDNPVERGRVREALPEVLVPEWPEDKLLYPSALDQLRCFDLPALSAEDAQRTRLYASDRERDAMRAEVGSLDAWLERLGVRAVAEPLGPSNLARAAQLLNKTNQMNLSTRRLTERELAEWAGAPGRHLWTVTVSDRFGEAGLTGIVSVEVEDGCGRVVDWVLSCRVMGRRVEEVMVHLAVETARRAGAASVEARLVPTAKNRPCLEFWRRAGLDAPEPALFRWDASRPYPLPATIQLEWRRSAAR